MPQVIFPILWRQLSSSISGTENTISRYYTQLAHMMIKAPSADGKKLQCDANSTSHKYSFSQCSLNPSALKACNSIFFNIFCLWSRNMRNSVKQRSFCIQRTWINRKTFLRNKIRLETSEELYRDFESANKVPLSAFRLCSPNYKLITVEESLNKHNLLSPDNRP